MQLSRRRDVRRSPAIWLRAVVLATLLAPAALTAQEPVAEIAGIEGRGEHRAQDERAWRAASVRQKLFPTNFVRALDMSRVVVKHVDGTGQVIGPNSEIQLMGRLPSGANGIRLNNGKTWQQSHQPARPVEIRTRSALAAVRGTDWEVAVDADGRTVASVFSGEIELSNELGSVTLGANEQGEAREGSAPVKLTLAVSRDRIQWVSSLTIDPARHPGEALPDAYRRLRGLAAPTPAQAILLADMELFRGDVPAARAVLQHAGARSPGDAAVEAALARVALFAGGLDDAAAHAQRAASIQPASPEVLLTLGDVERRRGRAREALAAYARAVELDARQARSWQGLGIVEGERENVRRARSHLERALALEPAEASHRAEMGTLEAFAGNLALARAHLERAVELNPQDYVALTGLGVVLLKMGDAAGALDALIKATSLEPRYSRAQLYAAVAYYQLERQLAALRMLERAAELDPNDPLPYLMRGIVHLDRIEPTLAAQAAQAALERIPYLKSLNQVADNQRGVANVGFPLAVLGLEAWARSAAHESYLPSWGASHLFLAERYPGELNRRSELMQGFMANPLAFGASNRFQSLTPRPGHFGTLSLRASTSDDVRLLEPVTTLNGLVVQPRPLAYFLEAIDTRVDPRNAAFELRGRTYTAAVGAKPTHELGLFVYANHLDAEADLGRAGVTGEFARVQGDASRLDAGVHYAPDSRSSWWAKAGASRQDARVDTLASVVLPQQALARVTLFGTQPRQRDAGLRHLFAPHQRLHLSWGVEAARAEAPRQLLRDVSFHLEGAAVAKESLDQRDVDRSTTFHALVRYAADAWRIEAGAVPSRYRIERDILVERLGGATRVAEPFRARSSGAFAGFVLKPAEALLARAACREWLRPASLDTLAPIAVAGIALDDQLVFAGGRLRQCRAQLEWTAQARFFASAHAERVETRNLVSPLDGVLNARADVTNLERLRNRVLTPPPKPDLLEDTPVHGEGVVRRSGLALEALVARGLAARLHYTHTASLNTAAPLEGLSIPYLPRHQAHLGFAWAPGWRTYVTAFAVYRSRRFADERNTVALPAGWDAQVNAFVETPDKRWALELFASGLLKKEASDVFGAALSYRF